MESDLSCREAEFLATLPPPLPFRDCFIITEEATGNIQTNILQDSGKSFGLLLTPILECWRLLFESSFNIDQCREQTLESRRNS